MESKNSPIVDMYDLLSSYAQQMAEAMAIAKEQEIINLLTGGEGLKYSPPPIYETYKRTYKLDLDKIDQELQQIDSLLFPSSKPITKALPIDELGGKRKYNFEEE